MEKEVSESDRRLAIRDSYLKKVADLEVLGTVDPTELYSLVKNFFAEFLKINYEFTYEELSLELNKILIKPSFKKEIDQFLFDITESEYLLENALEATELKILMQKFEYIINTLIIDKEKVFSKESIFKKIFAKKKTSTEKSKKNPVPQPTTADPGMIKQSAESAPMSEDAEDENIALLESEVTQDNAWNGNTLNDAMQTDNISISRGDSMVVQNLGPDAEKVCEFIEASYGDLDRRNLESAKVRYKNALDIYHTLNVDDKRKVFLSLYELFSRLDSV
jgi:hypothetical protein